MRRWLCSLIAVLVLSANVAAEERAARAEGADTPAIEELQSRVRSLAKDGRFDQAARLSEEALQQAEASYGVVHPSVAPYIGLVAGVYLDQGRPAEAGQLLRRVMWMWNALNEQGVALSRQRRYTEGLEVAQEALRFAEEHFGSEERFAELDQASILPLNRQMVGYSSTSMNLLGSMHEALDHPDKAETFYLRAVKLREMIYGAESFKIVDPLVNLALLYDDEGRNDEAEPLYRRLLILYEEAHGPSHPHFLKLLEKYAALLREAGRAEEAEQFEARVPEMRGNAHP